MDLIAVDTFLLAAEKFSWLSANSWISIAKVAFGLGFVIFVHELGHFLVAKACGVQCDKFYVGFDVPMPKIGPWQIPSKIFHFQYGETEYGLGIVPLGGYVKMLGQDDNPGNAEEERQKLLVRKTKPGDDLATQGETAETTAPAQPPLDAEMAKEVAQTEPVEPHDDDDEWELDPRSYPAKNVFQRMAIISAGVIMNVIFAVIFAMFAYKGGVPFTPTIIGATAPGSPAWEENLPLGKRVIQVTRKGRQSKNLRFANDFRQGVILHGYQKPLDLLLADQDGNGDAAWHTIQPQGKEAGMGMGKIATVGIISLSAVRLGKTDDLLAGTPAIAVAKKLKQNDLIIAGVVDGEVTKIDNSVDLNQFMARHADDAVTLRLQRTTMSGEGENKTEKITEHDIEFARNPLRRLGTVMTMGEVTAIQKDSPAATAGIKKGDLLQKLNGETIADPVTLPQLIRRLAGETITLTLTRKVNGNDETIDVEVTPRDVKTYQLPLAGDTPMLIDGLGLTYQIDAKIASLIPGSDAASKLEVGDVVTNFKFIPTGKNEEEKTANAQKIAQLYGDKGYDLTEDNYAWPGAFAALQTAPPAAHVELTIQRGKEEKKVVISPIDSPDFSYAMRGIQLQQLQEEHEAESWGEAFGLGLRETKESLLLVVTFLRKLATGQISVRSLGGPGMIAVAATSEASEGTSRLLIFLTMLSANLAVVNFLPIPVLDGGHMVFLAYEAIFRRPVNEKWAMRLTLLGLGFILSLMVFVIGMDIYRLSGLAG